MTNWLGCIEGITVCSQIISFVSFKICSEKYTLWGILGKKHSKISSEFCILLKKTLLIAFFLVFSS